MLTLVNMLRTKNEYFSKQISRKIPEYFMRGMEGNPFHLSGIWDKIAVRVSVEKQKNFT